MSEYTFLYNIITIPDMLKIMGFRHYGFAPDGSFRLSKIQEDQPTFFMTLGEIEVMFFNKYHTSINKQRGVITVSEK